MSPPYTDGYFPVPGIPKTPDPVENRSHRGRCYPFLQLETSQPRDNQAKELKERGRIKEILLSGV